MRGASKTEDIHLNVTLWDHQLFSKDNRRLVVLLMFQALRRDESIQVTCHIAAPDQEFHQKRDTQTDGLSILPRVAHASSKHLGADLFEPAAQAQQMNMRLARKISRKHNADHLGVQFLQKVKRKLSTSRDNADTLTWTSTGQSTRGCSRSPRRGAYRQFKHTATVAKRSRDAQASASEGAHEVEPPWKRRKHYQYSPKANELMSLVQGPLVDEHLILHRMRHISREDLVTIRDTFRGAGLLYYAAGRNLPRVVQILLESRADVDARDATKYMRTALWEAASQGHGNIIQMLIGAGADVNASSGATDRHPGRSPLSMAKHQSRHNAAQVLIAAGGIERVSRGSILPTSSIRPVQG